MHLRIVLGAVLAAVVFVLAIAARADERILDFDSDILVRADGSMDVVETIRVRAEGRGIRRGIYRDFPTDYEDRLGNAVRVGFELLEVRRDGSAEPYHTQRLDNGVRVYVGSADVILDPGEYEYAISYRTSHMLGFFDNHDELYWNVTGNGWTLPIERAAATVTLPDSVPADAVRVEGYTGPFGSTGQDYRAEAGAGAQARIETTLPLAPGEGLTVVVSWPTGHVDAPGFMDRVTRLLQHNLGLLIALASGLSALVYLLLAWHKVGRDPPPGVVYPRYEPPEGFSPASLRYVWKMRYDRDALAAAVLSLAVKGFVTIDKSGKVFTLRRTGKAQDDTLATGEAELLSALFAAGSSVVLENDNHAIVGAARRAHQRSLQRDHRKRYFRVNGIFLLPALTLLVGALAAVAMLEAMTIAVVIVFGVSAALVFVFAWLLKAPTRLGRKLLDKVDGFRLYLEIAEKDELALNNPPDRTPELFETFLPYAVALGVEQPWAQRFEKVFRTMEAEQGRRYRPRWYSGRWDSSNPTHMARLVGGSLGSAISSAGSPPGSSSGGGGGGSSGGGGGGGGGGGW